MLKAHVGHPVPLLPAQIRRWVETNVMVSLAGDEATRFWDGGFVSATDRDEREAVEFVDILTRPEREELELSERTRKPNDQTSAWELVSAVVGNVPSSTAYLAWLRAVTREVVWGPRCQQLISAVAPVLQAREVLSARAVNLILREADPSSPTIPAVHWEVAASND